MSNGIAQRTLPASRGVVENKSERKLYDTQRLIWIVGVGEE